MTIYLDNGATTRVSPAAREAMLTWLGEKVGNPSSIHGPGVEAGQALRQARETIARALGAAGGSLVFTSGGTEANALAILGTARRRRKPGHLVCSAIEHASVLETCRLLQAEGWALTEVPVDGQGLVSPDDVAAALRPDTVLVTVMHANNVIGTVQPLREIVRAVRARDEHVPIHTDAVQSFLKVPVDLRRLGVSLVTVSGHKVHGPAGIGALACAPGVHLVPLWRGGDQEDGCRPGTQNLAGAVGFAAAVEEARRTEAEDVARMARLRDRLIERVLADVPGARLDGPSDRRLPHNAHVSLPGVRSEPLLHALEARGVIASAGSACHATRRSLSHVLVAIGHDGSAAWGHLRLTLSRFTTEEEIEQAARAIAEAHAVLARSGTGSDR